MDIDQGVLQRYWLGQCTDAERKQVEDWLEAGEPPLEYAIHGSVDADRVGLDLWNALERSIGAAPSQPRRVGRPRWLWVGIAASLLAAILIGYRWQSKPGPEKEVALSDYRVASAPLGRKLTVTLSDGTVVHLNAGSNIRYPERFKGPNRRILLEGEGFFSVTADPLRPFVVETPHTVTEVLGTQFNLRDFAGDTQRSIVVQTGSVRYAAKGGEGGIVLHAQDRAVCDSAGMAKDRVNSADYTDWKDEVLRFGDIPLGEAIPLLERWYAVRIRLSDPALAALRVKASFRNAPLNRVLDDLGYLLNLHYRLKDQDVFIFPTIP